MLYFKNVPNHKQTERIEKDISYLINEYDEYTLKTGDGDKIIWTGNSYRAEITVGQLENETLYELIHWKKTICVVSSIRGLVFFDASYISTTTRLFQSRILNALMCIPGLAKKVVMVHSELNKKTNERTYLEWN